MECTCPATQLLLEVVGAGVLKLLLEVIGAGVLKLLGLPSPHHSSFCHQERHVRMDDLFVSNDSTN